MTEQYKPLKGGKFLNRYVIRATLEASTPFHIGDGTTVTPPRAGMGEYQIKAIATDANCKAYIPGSALRGALRDWLRLGYEGMTEELGEKTANGSIEKIRNNNKLSQKQKDNDIEKFIKEKASDLERIFGTQLNEGKLEVWDAYCSTVVNTPTDVNGQMCFWDQKRMTYVAKSVAIDPQTGIAEDGKLYNYELVPKGAKFEATFVAQNLTTEEGNLLLAVLNGFNDLDNPITIGAMTKLDFGVFNIANFEIRRLDNDNIEEWRALAKNPTEKRAGYNLILALKKGGEQTLLSAKLPISKTIKPHCEIWRLNLETPLVVRSGGSFVWKNATHSKTRNYRMEYNWSKTVKTHGFHHVSDLYHSVEIQGTDLKPYYHVPSSSVRGALRAWTIEHLLQQDKLDIEAYLKSINAGDLENKPTDLRRLDPILDLFGFAVEGADKEITKRYTKAGRITIRVDRFPDVPCNKPAVDGANWKPNIPEDFGPKNAARHIKPRNPLDRITHAAKEGGLHHMLEFSKEQPLKITFKIREAETPEQKKFDRKLMDRWKTEINAGEIRFGGLTGIGRGRTSVTERKIMVRKEEPNGSEE